MDPQPSKTSSTPCRIDDLSDDSDYDLPLAVLKHADEYESSSDEYGDDSEAVGSLKEMVLSKRHDQQRSKMTRLHPGRTADEFEALPGETWFDDYELHPDRLINILSNTDRAEVEAPVVNESPLETQRFFTLDSVVESIPEETAEVSLSILEGLSNEAPSAESSTPLLVENDQPETSFGQQIDDPRDTVAAGSTTITTVEDGPVTYPSPTERGRKRVRQEQNWRSNIRKKARNSGEEYENRQGKTVHARQMKPGCGQSCRLRCRDRFSQEERESIFNAYWSLGEVLKQRQYLSNSVHSMDKKTSKTGSSKRTQSLIWNLKTTKGEEKVVCKTFFLHTLSISETTVFTALRKTNDLGVVERDNRGGDRSGLEAEREEIRQHIRSFPVVDSHYCRKTTKRQYLGSHLNISLMYRLFKEMATEKGSKVLSLTTYNNIFNTEFNLGFHKPSKDQCDDCTSYRNANPENQEAMRDKFDKHLSNTQKVREIKDNSKERSKTDNTFKAICFDLEEVLMTPHARASLMYYKRKLNTFNLTIYDLGTSEVTCNVWHEGVAGRGANEIASCIYRYLEEVSKKGVKSIRLFSDSCGGQNRNKFFLTMLWLATHKFGFDEIEHHFFIKGHSKNENDSVHAAIETASRHMPVYTTPQWATVIRGAKHSAPFYKVIEADVTAFMDFKEASKNLKNFDLDVNRQKISWISLRSIRVSKDSPNIVKMRSDDFSEEWRDLNIFERIRKTHVHPNPQKIPLNVINSAKHRGIDNDKFNDLQDLCKKLLIPAVHHSFFSSLPISQKRAIDDEEDIE